MKSGASVKLSNRKWQGVKLFLLSLPFILATFIFAYLPLSGWRYAFFDFRAGQKLLDTPFVGLKHFTALVSNSVQRNDLIRVLRNTFAMSLLSIATSFFPMFFAIALTEIRGNKYRRVVQTVTTIPNFISWVLVYSLAFAMFSVNDGMVNKVLVGLGWMSEPINFLASKDNVWLSMLLYSVWKTLGWNAIMYIAAIMGIDAELFEAASIDGASRMQKIIHITIPCLLPTYFVLLMLSIGNFLNNGIDQYYVFQNALNQDYIEVLDLYVYNKGFVGRNISFSTAVGMLKSLISVVLLFGANGFSKLIRKESIL